MKADYLTYKQATGRSLLGLVIQLAMGLAMLIYAVLRGDDAALAGSGFILVGVLVWATLAILFDQHRRERVEAMEAEAFAASDAAASSVFDQAAQDLRVAAKRLRFTGRFLLPAVGLLVGLLLVGVGLLRFQWGRDNFSPEEFGKLTAKYPPHSAEALAIGLTVAFLGFVFARYVAGMAKQRMWSPLRGGASFAVGAALIGLSLAIGHFVKIAGPDSVLRYLLVVVPAFMVLIGAEVLVNFVLELYRPRKAGELPRPAFDSRILGFIAAPDLVARSIGEALSYQFGSDVTGSWFYRLLSRSVWKLVVLALAVMWAMSAMVVIKPHQQALILRFGRVVRVADPGLNLKLPWPIEQAEVPVHLHTDARGRVTDRVYTVTGLQTLDIGSLPPKLDTPILWTADHALQETFFLVQPATDERVLSTRARDLAAVVIEAPLQYVVRDVEAYELLGTPEMRDPMLKAAAQRVMTQYMAGLSISDILSRHRPEISEELRRRIEQEFIRINPKHDGRPVVDVVFVGIEGVHPPTRDGGLVTMAFENVVTQEQQYQALTTNARSKAVQRLTRAAGSADMARDILSEKAVLDALESAVPPDEQKVAEQRVKVRQLIERSGGTAGAELLKASAERWTRHMSERARVASYLGQIGSYNAAPAIYRASLYLDAVRQAMAKARVYIADPVPDTHIRIDAKDLETGANVFGSNEGEQK
ncbi:MAG: hypothetical protein IT437_12515 [Phycisphaerales bacterium]|nr:hypothetical protein [Phycisphaerales bacterium]